MEAQSLLAWLPGLGHQCLNISWLFHVSSSACYCLFEEQSLCQQSLCDVSFCKILCEEQQEPAPAFPGVAGIAAQSVLCMHILSYAGEKLASDVVAPVACLLLLRLG